MRYRSRVVPRNVHAPAIGTGNQRVFHSHSNRAWWGTAAVVLVAVALRAAALVAFPDNLHDDRDAYLELGRQLAGGHGYTNAATQQPTAFRPPLYPLVLAAIFTVGSEQLLGWAQLAAGVGAVYLTICTARRLRLGALSLLAGGFVAVDPLLVQYTTYPMTETLCTLLAVLLLWLLSPGLIASSAAGGEFGTSEVKGPAAQSPARTTSSEYSDTKMSALRQVVAGFAFGLCALSRPTFWAFGGLMALVSFWRLMRSRSRGGRGARLPVWAIAAAVVTVSPWVVRNVMVLGHPVLTTTHGGYTLLLGNNPVFYHEVVAKPWGTVWEDAPADRSQEAWYAGILEEERRELGESVDEFSSDRWMAARARRSIAEEPALFARACLLRFGRFWNVVPLRPARGGLPAIFWQGVGLFYVVLFAGFVLGAVRSMGHSDARNWVPALLLVVSFTLVHLVYWSNLRMRGPITPAIALVAALGWGWILSLARGRQSP